MIEQVNLQQIRGLADAAGQGAVRLARRRITRRMIVHQHEGVSSVADRRAQDFPRMGQAFVDRPERNFFRVDQPVPRVEQYDPQRLPGQILQQRPHESVNFLRRPQRLALRVLPRQTLAHFEPGGHFACLGQAHSLGQFAQLFHRHRGHPRQGSSRRLDHFVPDIHRGASGRPGAQKNSEQLRIAQRVRPTVHQLLPRPLLLRPVFDLRRRHGRNDTQVTVATPVCGVPKVGMSGRSSA